MKRYEPIYCLMRTSNKKRKPRFNSSAFSKAILYDTFNWYEVTDLVITGNYGATLIKKLEKGDL